MPKSSVLPEGVSASDMIDMKIEALGDWRGETLARVRALIHEALPDVIEEWKWGGPVWSRDGILCTGETYKAAVKLTFAKGAAIEDPQGLFNSSLEGATRRALDIPRDALLDETAFRRLMQSAAAVNAAGKSAKTK